MIDSLESYVNALAITGMPEREIARAYLYAEHFGLDSLRGPGCIVFDEPKCHNWDCLNPEHQQFKEQNG